MRRYRSIDHTGDAGITVYGNDRVELFQNAAYAFFQILTAFRKIRIREPQRITLSAGSAEELLVGWLNEFIYLFETRGLVFCRFEFHRLEETELEATAWGEPYDANRHPVRHLIKAVTYHQLRIRVEKGIWKTRIIFDL